MDQHTVDAKYRIVRLLGQGGMGAVYEAHHLGTGRRVALKMIAPAALESGGADLARFQREARASGAIDSQHVVSVLDTGVDPDTKRPYLVMEYLTGQDLLAILQTSGVLPIGAALRIVAQACVGLERAHEKDIVHRDIKSANLFVAQREGGGLIVKILDFGIAKVRADPLAAGQNAAITRTGALLGSPLYMSPEQALGLKDIDARTDVYSLGVTLYEAICGVTPNHECDSLGKLVVATCRGEGVPIRLRNPSVPDDVASIVDKALALDRNDRYQTVRELHGAIAKLLPRGEALTPEMMPKPGEGPRLPASFASGRDKTTPLHPPPLGSTPSRPPGRISDSPSLTPAPLASTATSFTDTSPTLFKRRSGLLAVAVAAAIGLLLVGGIGVRFLRAPQRVDGPDMIRQSAVSAAAPPATASIVAADPVPPRVEPLAETPAETATSPVTTAAAPHVAPAAPPVKKTAPVASTAAPNCDPPYTFGPDGRKIWKRDCL